MPLPSEMMHSVQCTLCMQALFQTGDHNKYFPKAVEHSHYYTRYPELVINYLPTGESFQI